MLVCALLINLPSMADGNNGDDKLSIIDLIADTTVADADV